MGNNIQKYYKKYDSHTDNAYYFNLGRSFIPCPRVCHFCLGYLDDEEIKSLEQDIETGSIETTTLPIPVNSFEEEYDIVSINEIS